LDTIDRFFSSIDHQYYHSMESVNGVLRIDVGPPGRIRRYRIEIDCGTVRSTRSDAGADCIVIVDESTFVEILRGTETPITMLIRSSITLQGDLRLFFLLARLLQRPANPYPSAGGTRARR
jgi:ubiquinone biosynthesis protein UbiJ